MGVTVHLEHALAERTKKAVRIELVEIAPQGALRIELVEIAALGDVPPPYSKLLNLEWISDWCILTGFAEFEAIDDFEYAGGGGCIGEFGAYDL